MHDGSNTAGGQAKGAATAAGYRHRAAHRQLAPSSPGTTHTLSKMRTTALLDQGPPCAAIPVAKQPRRPLAALLGALKP
jgi:hypothetical protein